MKTIYEISKVNLEKFVEELKKLNINAVLITNPYNIQYLTGLFRAGGTYLLHLLGEEPIILTPLLETTRVLDSTKGFKVLPYAPYKVPDITVEVTLNKLHKYIINEIKSKGIEELSIDLTPLNTLANKVKIEAEKEGIKVRDISELIANLRMIKSNEEVNLMRKALSITEEAIINNIENIKQGISQVELAMKINEILRLKGDWDLAFETIVASGPNSAYPHAIPTKRRIGSGDAVVIDAGAKYYGYCADMTRTFIISNRELEEKLEIINEALMNAVDKISDGIEISEVDNAARKTLEKHNLHKYYVHSTGHGVGIEVHEKPRISIDNKEKLRENTIVTIEPGIYIHGKYGLRIENMILVKKNKGEILNKTPNIIKLR